MKRKALLSATVLVAAGLLAVISAVYAQSIIVDPPEFYFTRLVYTENSGRGGGRFGDFGEFGGRTMPRPGVEYMCPEFGGGNFFPRQGSGWGTDYPGADCKFMGGINRLTGMRVHPNPNVVGIMDEDLFKFPYVYAVEVGGMYLSDPEAA